MSEYKRAVEDTVVDRCVCNACKGSGMFIGTSITGDPLVSKECEACGGTGTCNHILQREVIADLGLRNSVQPGYDKPATEYGVGIVEQYSVELEQVSNIAKGL